MARFFCPLPPCCSASGDGSCAPCVKAPSRYDPMFIAALSVVCLCVVLAMVLSVLKVEQCYAAQRVQENSAIVYGDKHSKGNEHLLVGQVQVSAVQLSEVPEWWRGEWRHAIRGNISLDCTEEFRELVQKYLENSRSSARHQPFSASGSSTRHQLFSASGIGSKKSEEQIPLISGWNKGKAAREYKEIVVEKVLRVENLFLWREYRSRRQNITSTMKDVELTDSLCAKVSLEELSEKLRVERSSNEAILIHGTDKETARTILQQGFDHRVGRLTGRYGAGCYFAEDYEKSCKYMKADAAGRRYLILTRVCLGLPFVAAQEMRWARRPPTMAASGKMADSVIGVGGSRYREFIVYDNRQCLPELLVVLR